MKSAIKINQITNEIKACIEGIIQDVNAYNKQHSTLIDNELSRRIADNKRRFFYANVLINELQFIYKLYGSKLNIKTIEKQEFKVITTLRYRHIERLHLILTAYNTFIRGCPGVFTLEDIKELLWFMNADVTSVYYQKIRKSQPELKIFNTKGINI